MNYSYKCVVIKNGHKMYYKRVNNKWKRITNKLGKNAEKKRKYRTIRDPKWVKLPGFKDTSQQVWWEELYSWKTDKENNFSPPDIKISPLKVKKHVLYRSGEPYPNTRFVISIYYQPEPYEKFITTFTELKLTTLNEIKQIEDLIDKSTKQTEKILENQEKFQERLQNIIDKYKIE